MALTQTYESAYNQAVKYLSIRLHTVGELSDKLRKKGYEQQIILDVLRHLEELDFINDKRYAQIFTENLKQYRDFGYYGVKAKLMKKRVPTDIIEEVMEEFFTPDDELVVARRYSDKLKRQGRDTYQQAARSFSSKGFRTEIIGKMLREVLAK